MSSADPPGIVTALEAKREMDDFARSRVENADRITLVAPYFSIARGTNTKIVVLNKFVETLDVELDVSSSRGNVETTLSHSVAPRGQLEIDLRQEMAGLRPSPRTGSLRLTFLGDAEMLQAWVVVTRKDQVMGFPLVALSDQGDAKWVSFWDTRPYGDDEEVVPNFVFLNTDDLPVELAIEQRISNEAVRAIRRVIPGGGTVKLALDNAARKAAVGTLTATHGGRAGSVVAMGFVEGKSVLARLRLAPPAEAGRERFFESFALPVPAAETGPPPVVTVELFDTRPSGPQAPVEVKLMAVADSQELWARELSLAPGQHTTFFVDSLREGMEVAGGPLRLQVRSPAGSVLPMAYILRGEDVVDVSLVDRELVHSSGTYPLPDFAKSDAMTTILNLGHEPSEVVGQVNWQGGTYAIGPLQVPAEGGVQLRFRDLAESELPDMLDRTVPRDFAGGFFHWRVRSGSRELLASTEVRDLGSFDSFGLNCFTECCPEFPFGDIMPGPISFNLGFQEPLFPVEMIGTCNGLMGPFNVFGANLSFSSPLSWNGQVAASGGLTNQRVSFSASRERLSLFCVIRRIFIGDDEEVIVDKCLKEKGPEGYDPRLEAGGCPGQTASCDQCLSCCEKLKDVANCRCDQIPGQSNCGGVLAAAACQTCKMACAGKFELTSCNSALSCAP